MWLRRIHTNGFPAGIAMALALMMQEGGVFCSFGHLNGGAGTSHDGRDSTCDRVDSVGMDNKRTGRR